MFDEIRKASRIVTYFVAMGIAIPSAICTNRIRTLIYEVTDNETARGFADLYAMAGRIMLIQAKSIDV